VLPLEFISLAEQIGIMRPIGVWVLREACRQAGLWRQASPSASSMRVNVNLCAAQIKHPEFIDEVRGALADTGIDPSCLVLEIAERLLVENVDTSTAVLQKLRELGVQTVIDDVGAAYSSMSNPTLFPVQGIKIDRDLVHRMGGRRSDLNIVRLIVDLARNHGLEVMAEGIETIAQRERLIAFGCERGQGFLFAKPLEPQAAGELLARTDTRIGAGNGGA
jgi:EAL domain-containing protein (putative c-di-GMP-specific phosphodiesterase class I)